MKKTSLLILCIGVMFLLAGVQEGMCAMKTKAKPPIVKPTPPDLSVTVTFVQVINYKNSQGIQCYSPRAVFTISNKGQTAAKNFDYVIEWKLNPSHTWQMFSGDNDFSLGPGATKTINGNSPVWEQPWCVNEPDWKPGWRITADTKNVVAESNESNNTAEKVYTPLAIPKTAPPRAIQKDFQKIPTPR